MATDEAPATATPAPARTIGERLRAGRERSGLSVAAAAEKLHLDPKVIEALESDRFADLGASVYVRGHLRRYGDFVGEPGEALVGSYAAREQRPPPPDLTQVPHAERRADPRRLLTPITGLGAVVAIAAAIWFVLSRTQPPAADATVATPVPSASTLAQAVPPTVVAVASPPVAAPSAPPAAAPRPAAESAATPPPAARETQLRIELTNDSWVEIYDGRGQRLYYDVASAGSVQSVSGRGPLRVILGNASGVAVQVDGQSREIPANALDGEGARFVVNRGGSLARARP